MEINDFAEMTYRVLKQTPLSEFLPTLCLPERRQILALDGAPVEEDTRQVALEWAESNSSPEEEFLVAYRDGERHFRIVRRSGGTFSDALYPEKKPA